MKKSLKIPLEAPVQVPEVNYKLKVFLNLLYYSISLSIIYFSHHYYKSVKTHLLFNQAKVKNIDGQLHLLTDVGLFFSILLLFNWVLIFVITSFKPNNDNPIVNAIKNSTAVSLEHFIIFIGIFSYTLINERYSKKQFLLVLNWFCLARILYVIGSVADIKLKVNLKQLGGSLSIFSIILMFLNVGNLNLLDYI